MIRKFTGFAVAGCAVILFFPSLQAESQPLAAEVVAVGLDGMSKSPVVLVQEKEGGQFLPIWVGIYEARAIEMALHNVQSPRPLTHDLAGNLLAAAEGSIEKIVIHELRGGTYYCFIHGKKRSGEADFILDSRPSDAIALALRAGAEIQIESRLLDDVPLYQFMPHTGGPGAVRLLGALMVDLSADARLRFELSESQNGVLVAGLDPAAQTKLKPGDIVTRINAVEMESTQDVIEAVKAAGFGQALELQILREGEEMLIEVENLPGSSESRSI